MSQFVAETAALSAANLPRRSRRIITIQNDPSATTVSAAAIFNSRVIASGATTLGGTVAFDFVNGFVPAAGVHFNIVTGSSRTGTFATTTIPSLPGRTALVTYQGIGARLDIGVAAADLDDHSRLFAG